MNHIEHIDTRVNVTSTPEPSWPGYNFIFKNFVIEFRWHMDDDGSADDVEKKID